MSVTIDRAMLSKLSERDLKVLIWRQKWLKTARADQIPPEDVEWNEMICLAGRGWGKLGCVETKVPTPVGWRRLGDIEPGDQVFDENGW